MPCLPVKMEQELDGGFHHLFSSRIIQAEKAQSANSKSYTGPHHLKISNGNGKLLVNSLLMVCRTSEGSSKAISFSGFSMALGSLCCTVSSPRHFNLHTEVAWLQLQVFTFPV